MLSEAKINELYVQFITKLEGLGINTEELVKFLGEENIKNAPAGLEASSGLAFPGALLLLITRSLSYAEKLWDMTSSVKTVDTITGPVEKLVNEYGVEKESLVKVILLHQLGKVMIFQPNDDEWQINKRGILYKWTDNETTIMCGERSQYICQRCGIQLTESEFEAMKINDKNNEDRFSMLHIHPLSMFVKMADDMTYMKINQAKRK